MCAVAAYMLSMLRSFSSANSEMKSLVDLRCSSRPVEMLSAGDGSSQRPVRPTDSAVSRSVQY